MLIVPNHKKNGDYYNKNPCLSHLRDKLSFKRICWEKKLFLQNQGIGTVYRNKENVFMVPNHEKNVGYNWNLCLSHLTNKL